MNTTMTVLSLFVAVFCLANGYWHAWERRYVLALGLVFAGLLNLMVFAARVSS